MSSRIGKILDELRGCPYQDFPMTPVCSCYEVSDKDALVVSPLVSVVIVIWNHESYLQEAIDSVLCQETEFPFEVLLCEDCSSDNSRQICFSAQKRFPNRVRVIFGEHNLGGRLNPLYGFDKARGEYISWLEGDDYWDNPRKLQLQVDKMIKDSTRFCVAWNKIRNDRRVSVISCPSFGNATFLNPNTYKGGYYHTSTFVFHKALWRDILPYLEKIPLYDTTVMLLGMSISGGISVLPEYVSVYRQTGEGIYTSKNSVVHAAISIKMFSMMRRFGPSNMRHVYKQSYFAALANTAIHNLRERKDVLKGFVAMAMAFMNLSTFNMQETKFLVGSMLKSIFLLVTARRG